MIIPQISKSISLRLPLEEKREPSREKLSLPALRLRNNKYIYETI
jgi:hypothetical protein